MVKESATKDTTGEKTMSAQPEYTDLPCAPHAHITHFESNGTRKSLTATRDCFTANSKAHLQSIVIEDGIPRDC